MKPKTAAPVPIAQLMTDLLALLQPEVYLESRPASPMFDDMVFDAKPGRWIKVDDVEDYFACTSCERPTVDLALIGGGRVFEDALRDFVHVERHASASAVAVFTDVLPTSQDMAWRVAPPAMERPHAYTGDVFKLTALLAVHRPDLTLRLVDAAPYGALIVSGLDSRNVVLDRKFDQIIEDWNAWHFVPGDVLAREGAMSAADAITELAAERKGR